MATPNFFCANAGNVYVMHDDTDIDILTEHIREGVLEELGGNKDLLVKDIYEHDDNRGYPAVFVTEINDEFEFCGLSFTVSIRLGARAGYYGSVNLDYQVLVTNDNSWGWIEPFEYIGNHSRYGYSSGEELAEALADELDDWKVPEQLGVSRGLFSMNRKRMVRRIESEIASMMQLADELCKKLCDSEYACVGVFSNGEAIYEAV